jgi:hypothetical protein
MDNDEVVEETWGSVYGNLINREKKKRGGEEEVGAYLMLLDICMQYNIIGS